MRHITKKVFKKSLSITILCTGFFVGFSGLSIHNAKTMLFHTVEGNVANENQQIKDSLTLLYQVPKTHADAPPPPPEDDYSCGCGCCGCG